MTELREVFLIGVPLAIQVEASEHYDELMREFDDIAATDTSTRAHVPARLRQLHDELRERFGGFSDVPQQKIADAIRDGATSVDLEYQIPPEAAAACVDLGALLDEADAYCAAGTYLLTLKTPPAPLAYRRWFLSQFIDQLGGADATSWSDWAAANAPELV